MLNVCRLFQTYEYLIHLGQSLYKINNFDDVQLSDDDGKPQGSSSDQ